MFLNQITIEGFKSYANRVVLKKFDPHFNAITGLNGTGKSNVLDAICFVLGISKVAKMRVQNLQGLIYKEGQSGVSKASVTLLFDNSDKAQAPPGYEDFPQVSVTRQVFVGGKTKYLINGVAAQSARVQNLFQSIHLNINNPHFIIMQGRIAKVLNMQPKEVLEMVEEVAGTKMYENKKENAERVMGKKRLKFDEINSILKEEIEPKLAKLDKEKTEYRKWQSVSLELEKTRKMEALAQNLVQSRQLVVLRTEAATTLSSLKETEAEVCEGEKKKKILEKELAELQKKESSTLEIQKANKREVETELIRKEERHKWLQEECKQLEQTTTKTEQTLLSLQKEFSEANTAFLKKKAEKTSVERALQLNKEKTALLVGKADTKEKEKLLEKNVLSLQRVERETTETEKKHSMLQKEFERARRDFLENKESLSKLKEEFAVLKEDQPARKQKMELLEQTEVTLENKKKQLVQLENELDNCRETVEALAAECKTAAFLVKDSKRFIVNDQQVKGTVSELMTLKEQKYTSALEAVAGNKLFQLVIDSAETGKVLLQENLLRQRCTMIPLDKIAAKKMDSSVVAKLKHEVGFDNAHLAVDLVSFLGECKKAADFVFGKSFVCCNQEAAAVAAFDKRFGYLTSTLEGDLLNPAGTLSGGYRDTKKSLLVRVAELKTLRETYALRGREKLGLEKEIHTKETKAASLRTEVKFANEAEMRLNRLEVLVRNKSGCSENELALMENKLKAQTVQLETLSKEKQTLEQEKKELGLFCKNASNETGATLRREVVALEKDFAKLEKELLKEETKLQNHKNNEKDLLKEIEENTEKIADKEKFIVGLEQELSNLRKKVNSFVAEIEKETVRINKENELLLLKEKEKEYLEKTLKRLNKAAKQLVREKDKLDFAVSELENKEDEVLSQSTAELGEEEAKQTVLQWTNTNLSLPKRVTTFEDCLPLIKEKTKRLEKVLAELENKINRKAFVMHEKTTKEFEEVLQKRNKVVADRAKLDSVIKELDKRKEQCLATAWQDVNKNFASIFQTLLPNASCQLVPVHKHELAKGLEIRVCLGEMWKESLSELSGGQRSLLALSLVLSLLLFKSAPIYVLDEVDAALDLSHTQNIGKMLSKHFKTSQFLVVSLKEGLFHNANVIFRTKLVDGVSSVTRTVKNS